MSDPFRECPCADPVIHHHGGVCGISYMRAARHHQCRMAGHPEHPHGPSVVFLWPAGEVCPACSCANDHALVAAGQIPIPASSGGGWTNESPEQARLRRKSEQ